MMLRLGFACAFIALSLSSCAGLGLLEFQGITDKSAPPNIAEPSAYGEYFKVEVSSTVDIKQYLERSSRDAVYVSARLCPVIGEKDANVIAFGPFDGRHRQRYDIYLVARHPEPHRRYSKTFLAEHSAYDLGRDRRDVCISMLAPGYPAAARSKELRVSAEMFSGSKSAN
jgi:hypothetical protein